MTTFTSAGLIKRGVLWYDKAHQEKVDDVEDADAPDDLLGGLGNLFSWVYGLSSSQSGEFGATKGK